MIVGSCCCDTIVGLVVVGASCVLSAALMLRFCWIVEKIDYAQCFFQDLGCRVVGSENWVTLIVANCFQNLNLPLE